MKTLTALASSATVLALFAVAVSAHADPILAETQCIAGQDLNAPDLDISACAPIESYPDDATMPVEGIGPVEVSLGAWELYPGYLWGGLFEVNGAWELHDQNGGVTPVDAPLVDCWHKSMIRLQAILTHPPAEYVKLHQAGFQYRFFMFLNDERRHHGAAWSGKITAYMDHLVKWNFSVAEDGTCVQHTWSDLQQFSAAELARRGIE